MGRRLDCIDCKLSGAISRETARAEGLRGKVLLFYSSLKPQIKYAVFGSDTGLTFTTDRRHMSR